MQQRARTEIESLITLQKKKTIVIAEYCAQTRNDTRTDATDRELQAAGAQPSTSTPSKIENNTRRTRNSAFVASNGEERGEKASTVVVFTSSSTFDQRGATHSAPTSAWTTLTHRARNHLTRAKKQNTGTKKQFSVTRNETRRAAATALRLTPPRCRTPLLL